MEFFILHRVDFTRINKPAKVKSFFNEIVSYPLVKASCVVVVDRFFSNIFVY